MRVWHLILATLTLSACAAHYDSLDDYLAQRQLQQPTKDTFQSCRSYGCRFKDTVTLSKKEWAAIDKVFKPKAKTPAQERKKIATAIALFETYVGDYTGTHEDVAGTFEKTGFYQQDCVDESTNTSIYLRVLEAHGHIKHHTIEPPTVRLPADTGRWPHQSAMIKEIKSDEAFAVDSWFYENGAPPEIIPLAEWKQGWKPEPKTDTIKKD